MIIIFSEGDEIKLGFCYYAPQLLIFFLGHDLLQSEELQGEVRLLHWS
jgi:hypothetical protein